MGKEFAAELRAMAETYRWALGTPIGPLELFVNKSKSIPMIAVGSGGSMTAATLASVLHGDMSCAMTPLEFLDSCVGEHHSVALFSAGGKNKDILAAYVKAFDTEPAALGVVCNSTENQLMKDAEWSDTAMAARPPTGRDGFLATNSLLATAVWLARAYGSGALPPTYHAIHDGFDPIPRSLQALAYDKKPESVFRDSMHGRMGAFKDVETLIVVHDNVGKPAAVDLESKMSEAGLANVLLADYRNFAHGRYNWLDKRTRTGIIALGAPSCKRLADVTIGQIPADVPLLRLDTAQNSAAACIELLVKSFYVVDWFGRLRGIDPGRPRVPKYGRKLHWLDVRQYDGKCTGHVWNESYGNSKAMCDVCGLVVLIDEIEK